LQALAGKKELLEKYETRKHMRAAMNSLKKTGGFFLGNIMLKYLHYNTEMFPNLINALFKVAIMCLKMQFAVLYTSYAVMGYKQLHGFTWSYIALHDHLAFCCQQL
jgi:hypothetical protein